MVFKFSFLTGIFVLLLSNSVSAQLVHPGGWHTQDDLTLIRAKVAAGEEPWITGWNAIKDESPNADYTISPTSLITSNSGMSGAGFAAWVLTMKWVASGDQAYADAAMGVIDDWVSTVEEFDVYGPTLTLSTGAGAMAQAAEILEHGFDGEAGWSASSANAARTWLKDIIYDTYTNVGDMRSTNWGTSCVGGNMSMAIFCDDEEMFDDCCDAYKYGYQDTDDGCCAVTDYIFDESGQAQESGRDQAHVQGGIAHLTEAALCAWNQGVDLVSIGNNRILAGVEYHAKYNLGYDDVPFTTDIYNPCDISNIYSWDDAISEDERGNFSPVYCMSSKLFSLAGLAHPYTEEVIASSGYSPEINNFAHPGLGTLVFVVSDNFDAFSTIEAEDYCDMSGIDTEDCDEGGENVGWIDNDDWIMFTDVEFGNGAESFDARVASKNGTGTIELRLGSTSGTLIGSVDVSGTSGWQDWTTISCNISGASGTQDLYLVFSTGGLNINWFEFTATSNSVVQLLKRNSTDFAIDGNNGASDGQSVYLWASDFSNENQQWVEINRGDGYYSYQKYGTNYCLDGGNGGANGQDVYLWTCDAANQNQHWEKIDAGNDNYRLQKRGTSFSIDGGNDGANGQNVYLWSSSSTNQNQQWGFNYVDSNLKSTTVSESDIIKNNNDEKVNVYPNPVKEILTIDNAEGATLEIYNSMGEFVLTDNVLNNHYSVDLSFASPGIYVVKIADNGIVSIKKIAKNN